MFPRSRLMSGLLLLAFVAALPGTQVFAMTMPAGHPAGCHDSGPSPADTPSYECCISGHHWAMPGAAFSLHPLVDMANVSEPDHDAICSVPSSFEIAVAPSVSPPGSSPLRI